MTDFNTAIESRLAAFRGLHGRGNVRDSGNILFEIIQMMYAMIKTPDAPTATEEVEEIAQSVVSAVADLPFMVEPSFEPDAAPVTEPEAAVVETVDSSETVTDEAVASVETVADTTEEHTAHARRAKGKK